MEGHDGTTRHSDSGNTGQPGSRDWHRPRGVRSRDRGGPSTGGTLITLERDTAAAMDARAACAAAGVDRIVLVMIGDAARYLHKIAGPFDLILQDSDPAQYSSLHEKLVPLLGPAGTLLTRNLAAAGGYNELLAADARLTTAFLHLDDGLALSVKRLELT